MGWGIVEKGREYWRGQDGSIVKQIPLTTVILYQFAPPGLLSIDWKVGRQETLAVLYLRLQYRISKRQMRLFTTGLWHPCTVSQWRLHCLCTHNLDSFTSHYHMLSCTKLEVPDAICASLLYWVLSESQSLLYVKIRTVLALRVYNLYLQNLFEK